MCGRFAVTTDPARLAVELDAVDETGGGATGVETGVGFAPNYNVAPTTEIAAVVADRDVRRIRAMRWGLLPHWVKADADGRPVQKAQLINARAETVTTSPAYRAAAEHKRCLVPMDGYYEWKPNPDTPKRGRKTPYFFYRPDGRPLLVAGLWSVWRPDGKSDPVLTCTVITTAPPARFAEVHDRMPLVLDPDDWDRWLDPDRPAPAALLAGEPDVAGMAMREVSTLVNAVANNGPELIEPAGSVGSIEPADSVALF
jgi:putative SOS response-associated peptidase YedK